MIPFFSRTGTKRNLAAARGAGWGILVSAAGVWRDEGFDLVAADNGQWSERENTDAPFNADRFNRFLDWLGDRATFIVLPDIVCGGLASLDLSLTWLAKLRGHSSILLIPVQNGMTPQIIAPFLSDRVGIFVGGDTEWKEATLGEWGQLAADAGCLVHVGRVNTVRRIRLCQTAGVHSIDGSSVTRFACTLPPLDMACRQGDFAPLCRDVSHVTRAGYNRRCREIRAQLSGHAAHQAFDTLTNDVLRSWNFGAGVYLFEEGVREWHRTGLPYPLPDAPAHPQPAHIETVGRVEHGGSLTASGERDHG